MTTHPFTVSQTTIDMAKKRGLDIIAISDWEFGYYQITVWNDDENYWLIGWEEEIGKPRKFLPTMAWRYPELKKFRKRIYSDQDLRNIIKHIHKQFPELCTWKEDC